MYSGLCILAVRRLDVAPLADKDLLLSGHVWMKSDESFYSAAVRLQSQADIIMKEARKYRF